MLKGENLIAFTGAQFLKSIDNVNRLKQGESRLRGSGHELQAEL